MIRGIYYGWWIVLAAFCTLFVCAGIGFFSFTVFLKHIELDMEWSRTSLSTAGALAALAAGFASPAIGYGIDRHGPRVVMIPGALLISASFLFLGRINAVSQLYILFVAIGIGMAAATVLPCQTLVSRWFDRKRGRAMGIVMVATGLGGMIWMPISNRLIETIGWRNAYEVLGIVIAAISLPLIVLVIRSSPEVMGLTVDGAPQSLPKAGAPEAEEIASVESETGYTAREAFGTASFWLILSAVFFVMFGGSGLGLHVVPFLSDAEIADATATAVWSTALGVSVVGRFLFGFLSERYQKRYFAAASHVSKGLSLLLLVVFSVGLLSQTAVAVQFVVLYGLGLGCSAVMGPLVVGETFGVKAFGKLMGLLGIPYTLGMALGQLAGGYLFDLRGDYTLAFGVFALAFVIAGIMIGFAKPCFLLDSLSGGREEKS